MVDAIASDYTGVSEHDLNQVLYGLRDLLSMSRGGNEKLLSLLNMKMSAIATTSILPQPQSVERFVEDILLSIDDNGNWHYEDCFPQLQLDLTSSAMSSGPSDGADVAVQMPSFTRSPSPLTQLLLGGSWGSRDI